MKKYIVQIIFICLTYNVSSQIDSIQIPDSQGSSLDTLSKFGSIKMIYKFNGEKLNLRWAPDNYSIWTAGIADGYVLEKFMIPKNIEIDTNVVVFSDTIKVWKETNWKDQHLLYPKDSMLMIAGDMIYSTLQEGSNLSFDEALLRKNELQQKYSLNMLAADLSQLAADGSALAYEENKLDKDFLHVYQVNLAKPLKDYPVEGALIIVDPDSLQNDLLPKIDLRYEGEKHVKFSWNRSFHEKHFTAYDIEKSIDGINFEKINKTPFISTSINMETNYVDFQFTDSLKNNYEPYYYRMIARTPFGDLSPPSPIIKAMGRDRTPPEKVKKVKADWLDGNASLSWTQHENTRELKELKILKSANSIRDFEAIETLDANATTFQELNIDEMEQHYYVVAAVDTAGNESRSLPVYLFIQDSIPPSQPQGLIGEITQEGKATINWNLGKERDIIGYKLYYAHQEDHVFAQYTNSPYQDTTITFDLDIKNLTEDIYYKLVAVDRNFNHSEFSEVLKLKKPDLIPPTAPVFKDYRIKNEGIELSWENSSSLDVEEHFLKRRKEGQKEFVLLDSFSSGEKYYVDEKVEPNIKYEYVLLAKDDDGNFSDWSKLVLKSKNIHKKPEVPLLKVKYNKESKQASLTWNETAGAYIYKVYRMSTDEALQGIFETKKLSAVDIKVVPGKEYQYRIVAISKSGTRSEFGEGVVLNVLN